MDAADVDTLVADAAAADIAAGRKLKAAEDCLAERRLTAAAAAAAAAAATAAAAAAAAAVKEAEAEAEAAAAAVKEAEAEAGAAKGAAREAAKGLARAKAQRAIARKRKRKAEAHERKQRRRQKRMADAEARDELERRFGGPIPMITREQAAWAVKTFGPGDWSEAGQQRLTDAAMVLWRVIATGEFPPGVAPAEDGRADKAWHQPLDFGKLQGAMSSRGLVDDNGNVVGVQPLSGEDADRGWNDWELLQHLRDTFMESTCVPCANNPNNPLYVYNDTDVYVF